MVFLVGVSSLNQTFDMPGPEENFSKKHFIFESRGLGEIYHA